MRTILPTLPTPILPTLSGILNKKQFFQIGDGVNYHFRNIDSWSYDAKVVAVKRYKLFGVVWGIKYRLNFTTVSQRHLIKDQKVYEKLHNIQEGEVVKYQKRLFTETEGRW